jgi:Animal haem peroxidase
VDGQGQHAAHGYHASGLWPLFQRAADRLDRSRGWDRLPLLLALPVLVGARDVLRRHNLVDTCVQPATGEPDLPPDEPRWRTDRSVDGSWNDLARPRTGMAGTRFGRNVPVERTWPEQLPGLLEPSPREVSRALMTRGELVAATGANALVAAWLQFMIRDWFSHGKSPSEDPWTIELLPGDDWPQPPMTVPRTRPDPTRVPGATTPPTYANACSHWWDASQVYGTTKDYQDAVRTHRGGHLRVEPDGSLPLPQGEEGPVAEPGFWLGLVMLQTVFTLEHNAICDRLAQSYPSWEDEQLFQRARVVLAAVIAKIHTVEWTPAVISHPASVTGLRATWWGLLGERITSRFGRLSRTELLSGAPGSATDDYGVPYALTEEFTAVYRMHPLVPDDFSLRSLTDDGPLGTYTLRELSNAGAVAVAGKVSMADLLYSFGTLHPGVCTLHNFPRSLQEFERPDGRLMDLAATDILRHRELGVPRYCEFRRQMHLRAPATFEQLTDNPQWAQEISRVYGGDIERVDLMVGMFAERLPKGFAFSDTAFRIFLLMASRRITADRFFTTDYTPAVYTPEGMSWVVDATMAGVLLRHYPQLRPALRSAANAFLPWERAGG